MQIYIYYASWNQIFPSFIPESHLSSPNSDAIITMAASPTSTAVPWYPGLKFRGNNNNNHSNNNDNDNKQLA